MRYIIKSHVNLRFPPILYNLYIRSFQSQQSCIIHSQRVIDWSQLSWNPSGGSLAHNRPIVCRRGHILKTFGCAHPYFRTSLFDNMPLPALDSTGRGPHGECARRIPGKSNIYLLKPASYFTVHLMDIDKSSGWREKKQRQKTSWLTLRAAVGY